MSSPSKEEETGRVIQARSSSAIESVNTTAQRYLISEKNTGINSEKTASEPPANGIAQEVNLLARLTLSPEAHTTEQERPLVRVASIRVAAGKLAVMVEHGTLELEPLLEEGQRLDLALRLLATRMISR